MAHESAPQPPRGVMARRMRLWLLTCQLRLKPDIRGSATGPARDSMRGALAMLQELGHIGGRTRGSERIALANVAALPFEKLRVGVG